MSVLVVMVDMMPEERLEKRSKPKLESYKFFMFFCGLFDYSFESIARSMSSFLRYSRLVIAAVLVTSRYGRADSESSDFEIGTSSLVYTQYISSFADHTLNIFDLQIFCTVLLTEEPTLQPTMEPTIDFNPYSSLPTMDPTVEATELTKEDETNDPGKIELTGGDFAMLIIGITIVITILFAAGYLCFSKNCKQADLVQPMEMEYRPMRFDV